MLSYHQIRKLLFWFLFMKKYQYLSTTRPPYASVFVPGNLFSCSSSTAIWYYIVLFNVPEVAVDRVPVQTSTVTLYYSHPIKSLCETDIQDKTSTNTCRFLKRTKRRTDDWKYQQINKINWKINCVCQGLVQTNLTYCLLRISSSVSLFDHVCPSRRVSPG